MCLDCCTIMVGVISTLEVPMGGGLSLRYIRRMLYIYIPLNPSMSQRTHRLTRRHVHKTKEARKEVDLDSKDKSGSPDRGLTSDPGSRG